MTETAQSGEFTLTLTTDRSQARVAEPVRLTVEVRGPAGAEIEFPDVPAALEEFILRDHSPIELADTDGARVWRQWFDLESNLSGSRQIHGVNLAGRSEDEPLATAAMTIEVVSAIEEEAEFDPTRFADIQGPVEIPRPRNWLAVYVGAGAAVALAVLIWGLLRQRAARLAAPAPPPPPHVWAMRQLDELLSEKLIERGLVQEFYYRLSTIVRTYIELRFALMAPERTTKEFLVEVQRSEVLRWGHKDSLGEFLTACDLVKFARHEPRGADIDATIDAARNFIRHTAPGEATSVTGAAA